jgi:hypothetical protein
MTVKQHAEAIRKLLLSDNDKTANQAMDDFDKTFGNPEWFARLFRDMAWDLESFMGLMGEVITEATRHHWDT